MKSTKAYYKSSSHDRQIQVAEVPFRAYPYETYIFPLRMYQQVVPGF